MRMRNLFFIFLIILVIFLFFFSFLFYQFNNPKEKNGFSEISFKVEKGQGFREIARNLEKNGLIKSAKTFEIYLFLKGWLGKLKPGNYYLSPSFPLKKIAERIVKGPLLEEVEITIPEGKTIYWLDNLLSEKGVIKKGELINFQPSPSQINRYPFLAQKPKKENLEGFLFPDTYRFPLLVSENNIEVVVNKLLENFSSHLNSTLLEDIEKSGRNLYEVLILASLLEKEIFFSEEKPKTADILLRRLKRKMPLQVDASVVYAKMKKYNLSWLEAADLQEKDYQIDSPYNTYLFLGLPPTPICNPGLDSIKAAVYPEKNNYWYYLTDKKTKKAIFSRTFLEHKKAKKIYLK